MEVKGVPHLLAVKLKINKNPINIIIYAQLDTGSYVHSIQAAWHELKRVADESYLDRSTGKHKANVEHSTQDKREMAPKNGTPLWNGWKTTPAHGTFLWPHIPFSAGQR